MQNRLIRMLIDMVGKIPYFLIEPRSYAMGILHEVASVTSKGQVTLPKSIRQLLGVETGDRIAFDVLESKVVVVRRAEDQLHNDPAIVGFLTLLEQGIRSGKSIVALPEGLTRSMLAAAESVSSEPIESLEDEIEGDVAL